MVSIIIILVVVAIIVAVVVAITKKNKSNSLNYNTMENNSNGARTWSSQGNPTNDRQQIIINQQSGGNPNGIGTAGFILALVSLLIGSLPGVGWICWLLGLIFSCIGLSKTPKGLAVAGVVISLVGLVLILVLSAAVFDAVSNLF